MVISNNILTQQWQCIKVLSLLLNQFMKHLSKSIAININYSNLSLTQIIKYQISKEETLLFMPMSSQWIKTTQNWRCGLSDSQVRAVGFKQRFLGKTCVTQRSQICGGIAKIFLLCTYFSHICIYAAIFQTKCGIQRSYICGKMWKFANCEWSEEDIFLDKRFVLEFSENCLTVKQSCTRLPSTGFPFSDFRGTGPVLLSKSTFSI